MFTAATLPLGTEAVNEVHQLIGYLIHQEDNNCYYHGSNHDDHGRFNKLFFGGPRSLVTQFVVRLLDICK